MTQRKIFISIMVLLVFMCLHTKVQAKYVYSEAETAIKFNVEKYKPDIVFELKKIENNNTGYEEYANNSHTVSFYYELKTESKVTNHIYKDEIVVKLDGEPIDTYTMELYVPTADDKNCVYEYLIRLKNVQGNGNLSLEIVDKALKTSNNLISSPIELETGIKIDNIAPEIFVSENMMEGGKSGITITGNEPLRIKDGWTALGNEKVITKEFPSNVSYKTQIIDYAGNAAETEIKVSSATFVELTVGAYNTNYGWSYGKGDSEIVGKQAAALNTKNKTESLIFRVDGNADDNFIQARAFVSSYWQNNPGYCRLTNQNYNYGFNPSDDTWKSMLNSELVEIDGTKYVQLGGTGMNVAGNTDITGESPLPEHIALMSNYGISATCFKLSSRTCCLHPASATHRQMTDEQLDAAGVGADLIRLSCGIENVEDLIADIAQALENV